MLHLENLLIRQGDFSLTAEFEIPSQGITALIGPSGAGKSTLLSVLAGFLAPHSGHTVFQGESLNGQPPAGRPFAVLFQDNNLFPHLTITQNVGLALTSQKRLSADQFEQVQTALASVGLEGFGDRKPAALSGGQQSRAALARVLLQDKPYVLLDEPFSALGPALRAEMLDLVQEKVAGASRSVIMVTHDPADAKRIAAKVILVADGAANAPVDTQELFANPPEALSFYLGQGHK